MIVSVGERVDVGSGDGVYVGVGTAVSVDVGVGTAVSVDVGVGTAVNVEVGVGIDVGTSVGVFASKLVEVALGLIRGATDAGTVGVGAICDAMKSHALIPRATSAHPRTSTDL